MTSFTYSCFATPFMVKSSCKGANLITECDTMSDKTPYDQTPEVIAKEILVAYLNNKGVAGPSYEAIAETICFLYDEIHKQVIKSLKENYK